VTAEPRRILGGVLLLAAGAALWIWNVSGDQRPALDDEALAAVTSSPAPLAATPLPSASPVATPNPQPTRAPVARAVARQAETAHPKPSHHTGTSSSIVHMQQPASPAAPLRVAYRPRVGRTSPPRVAASILAAAQRDYAKRAARSAIALDIVDRPGTVIGAPVANGSTVRVTAWSRATPKLRETIVLHRTANGLVVVRKFGSLASPIPSTNVNLAASPAPALSVAPLAHPYARGARGEHLPAHSPTGTP
jgi:hypothetical protein